MIVNYIAAAEAYMQSAQERVGHGFQVLRAYGWQSDQPHVVMSCNCRCKVVAAVNRYIIAVRGQPSANFFVVSFNSTVFSNDTAPSYERHPHWRPLLGVWLN